MEKSFILGFLSVCRLWCLACRRNYVAGTTDIFALLHDELKNYGKALAYFIKAYKIYINKLGFEHPNTKICRQNMKTAYSEWKQEGDFEQWLEEQMKEQMKEPEQN